MTETKTTHTCLHCALLETAAVWMKEHQGIDAIADDKSVAFAKLSHEHHNLLAQMLATVTGQVVGAAPMPGRNPIAIAAGMTWAKAANEQAAATDAVKN